MEIIGSYQGKFDELESDRERKTISIEAGDETQQRQGLQLLARWAEFWSQEGPAIQAKLQPD